MFINVFFLKFTLDYCIKYNVYKCMQTVLHQFYLQLFTKCHKIILLKMSKFTKLVKDAAKRLVDIFDWLVLSGKSPKFMAVYFNNGMKQ